MLRFGEKELPTVRVLVVLLCPAEKGVTEDIREEEPEQAFTPLKVFADLRPGQRTYTGYIENGRGQRGDFSSNTGNLYSEDLHVTTPPRPKTSLFLLGRRRDGSRST